MTRARKTAMPARVEPQLCQLVTDLPTGDDWVHEIKLDGYRILARLDRGRVTLLTRNAQDWTAKFPGVARAVATLPARQAWLDGEIVVPLAPRESWLRLKKLSQAIAEELARRHPKDYTAGLPKSARVGKIFVDYLRNARGATAVAAYSTRARVGAPVSTPLAWDELGRGGGLDQFTVKTLPKRLATLKTDPWAGYFKTHQAIPGKFLAAVRRGTR